MGKGNAFAPSGGHSQQHVAIVREVQREKAVDLKPPTDLAEREDKT